VIDKKIRDIITTQALKEIDFARTSKQPVVWRFQKNENDFYERKVGIEKLQNKDIGSQSQLESRSNIRLGKMKSFIRSLLSKIDSPLTFKYKRGTIADLTKAELLNALKERDASLGDWNQKDLAGKLQLALYDRAIFSYHADSKNGYCSYLENVDVYDFLIDPSAGGIDLDRASYLGRYGVKKTKQELKEGVKSGDYLKTETERLIRGVGNNDEVNQEEVNKQNRYAFEGGLINRIIKNDNVYKFWEWYTTYEGERYYALLSEDSGVAIRVEKLTDIFREDKELGDAPYPFWTYASIIDLTEFWTPSYADGVREVFYAQSASINQMLDNAEAINKPQRKVDISKLESLADLVYKRNGIIRFKAGTDVNSAFQVVQTPSIDTPLKVYEKLEQIQQIESGVTSGVKGNAEEDKVGIYEGNIAQAADQFGLLNKSYSAGYKRFAKLYWYGVEDHLTKKVAVKILGSKGLEKTVFVGRKDVRPSADYEILIESSDTEAQTDNVDKRNKINWLAGYKNNPIINQKVLFEMEAEIIGLEKDKINSLLDVQDVGTAKIISEAERDIESILDGKIIEPNMNANIAYANYFIEYLKDHKEDLKDEEFLLFTDYLNRLEIVVVNNTATDVSNLSAKSGQGINNPQIGNPQGVAPQGQPVAEPVL
jgi:hypothetical protein